VSEFDATGSIVLGVLSADGDITFGQGFVPRCRGDDPGGLAAVVVALLHPGILVVEMNDLEIDR
jgi:hypothetical protein